MSLKVLCCLSQGACVEYIGEELQTLKFSLTLQIIFPMWAASQDNV